MAREDLRFAAWFLWMTPLEAALSSFFAASAASSFAWAASRKANEQERLHYRAVAHSSEGEPAHDVTGLSDEQLINDLLNRYARFRHAWRMT